MPEGRVTGPVESGPVKTVVVIPTYQEGDNIERLLRELHRVAPEVSVLIVDDNSPDGTGRVAERVAAELGGIEVIHRAGKAGLGAAYRHGFRPRSTRGPTSSPRWTPTSPTIPRCSRS